MLLRFPRRRASRKGEQGYVLMALLLIFALMAIATAAAITSIKFNLQRDREEEMIHRGAQYARAIRAYYKKFGRYPATIENLENTNQMRFLRKRYKDPITKRDFRLLHFGEVKMAMGGMGGGVIPGASTLNSNGKLTNNASGTGSSSVFGNNNNQNTNQDNTKQPSESNDSGGDAQNASGSDASNSGDQGDQGSSGQTFGGLPIVGVASFSREVGIREFDKKKKYNEWQFVYDPTLDRGMLITAPYQPMQQMFGMPAQNVNGQPAPTPGLGAGAPGAPPATPVSPTGAPLGNPNPNPPTDTPNQQ